MFNQTAKKTLSIVLAGLILSITAAGCGNSSSGETTSNSVQSTSQESSSSSSANSDEKIELRAMWWGSQVRHDGTMATIKLFEEANPNIHIEVEYGNWDSYWEKMAPQAAAGTLPDIMQHDYQYIKQYIDKDLLLPLDDYVSNGVLDLSDCDKNMYSAGIFNEKLYGVAAAVNAMAIVYDPEDFIAAGLEEPTNDWTWQDYINAANTIHKKLGIYGDATIAGHYDRGLPYYLREHGIQMYNEDGTALGFTDPKYFIDFYGMAVDLIKAGAVPTFDKYSEVTSNENNMVVTGKAAMSGECYTSSMMGLTQAAGKNLAIVDLPHSEDRTQPGNYLKPACFWVVPKNSEHPEAAASFISFFTNNIDANKVLKGERGVPIASKVREALNPLLDDASKLAWAHVDAISTSRVSTISPPDPNGQAEVLGLLKDVYTQMGYGQISVEEGANTFMQGANEILAKNAQ